MTSGTNVTEITDKADNKDVLIDILLALAMNIDKYDKSQDHSVEEGDQPIDAIHSIHYHAQNDNDAGVNECKSTSKTQNEPAMKSIDDIFIVEGDEEEQ